MSCRSIDAAEAKPAFRLPGVVETLEASVGLDRAMASYASTDAKRFG
ncbi:MAG: hypothetical protein OXN97_03230 [Bryobacterales bacterium]|nr:hypothetical protein [Bryobacterales bacterium]MDE0628675.1 hypothetical protein [Bryobacterales bacterium]